MITIPSLNDVTDILDTDMVMVTQQSGQSYKIAGSELNKRGKIIIANSTTITGAPLKAGSSVRVYFTVDLTAANASTTLQLNYNNVNYYVKAPKDGTLINFVATNLGGSPAVYKYLQKYTTLELLFDGTQFVIIGNPVILSSADYTIYADGTNVKKSIQSNLFRTYKEVPLGASDKIIQVGYCPNDIMQTFSFLEIFGGRVSGEYGKAYICVAGNAILSAKSVFPISNCEFRKKNINNKLYIYAILSTYCYLAINGFNGSRFVLEMQEISELPSDTSAITFTEM